MQKVFLSHCSSDKESYVRIVANKLIKNIGEENVILDEITFQQARKTIEEIETGLNETDLFVIFISESSLESEWVQTEVFRAKELWDEKKLNQICPIIINENIMYDNEKIPDWLRDNYNLQYISRPRFNEEVRKIKGANFYFLYGFYYRQIGKFDKALEMLDKSMEERSNFYWNHYIYDCK